ncbi:uncharacterized protein LOC131636912 [Vicia villosa]|uniref:uncharacterized protein LOC131636912 n=1 Tax=Vicia villosa TaxID=3911 RepID=UPI00273CA4C6|nr:uncharacterized protein LOC131636912 [Vicia villosa]
MAQFMEALTNVTKGQDDLRVLVENSRRNENGGHHGLFDDVSGKIDDYHDPNEFNHVGGHYNPFNQHHGHSAEGAREEVERYHLIEECLRAVEVKGVLGMDINDLVLVPSVRIPPKFKVPSFDKYNGATCPMTHAKAYYRKMSVYSENEGFLMHFFQDSLAGASLECTSASFAEMVRCGERVEMGLKMGKIQLGGVASSTGGKKPSEDHARKREGNADAVYGRSGQGRGNSQVNAVTIPMPQQQQQGQHPQYQNNQYRQRRDRKIDPIPMTYAQVLQHLLKIEKITLRDAPHAPDTRYPNYNANAWCVFQSGAPGHDTERCIALKNKVQDLLDQKIIQFTPTPNIVHNPMPTHGGSGVNAIESEEISVVSDVGCLTFPLVSVKQHLVNSGIFLGCGVDCENCKSQPEGCADLKSMVQKLIDEGPLQFYRRLRGAKSEDGEVAVISIPYEPVAPIYIQVPIQIPVSIPYEEQLAALMITVPGPIPYESEKVVPWHYGSDVYYYGMKEEGESSKEKLVEAAVANTDNFAGTSRITRSGRNGAPDNAVSSKDVEDLLRIIKKSDYKEISVNQLEAVANNISAGNGLGFTDRDFPPEGRNHNKVFHISMECKGTPLSRVLVDTGSFLNVLPKSALIRIDYVGVELRPSELVVRSFDGSKRSVFGEVDLPIQVGPQIFTTTFYVMDIQPAYCCLLGRPWIHKTGAVTSTLH